MLGGVSRRPRSGVAMSSTALTLLAIAGTWIGHTLEYVRVWDRPAFGSVHSYMGPVGAALAVAALVGVRATARMAARLQHRLDELSAGRLTPGEPVVSRGLSFPALIATLWISQTGLYLLQENLEQLVAHHPAVGLGPITGMHALAPLVQGAVAALLAAAVWLARRQVSELADAILVAEARLGVLWPAPSAVRLPVVSRTWTPVQRWGMKLWSRPPPVAV
jgi:hypothetical protein